MPTNLNKLKMKQATATASVDQLESYLYDNISAVHDLILNATSEELIDNYGEIEACLMTYAHALLVLKTSNEILERFHK